jgi:hypothetical protein
MKHFIAANWYRLITVTTLFIFSTAFFISAIQNNMVKAGTPTVKLPKEHPGNVWIIPNDKGIYEITWDATFSRYKCDKIFNEKGQ